MRDRHDRTILAWWATLGLGLGLILLSALLWVARQDGEDRRPQAFDAEVRQFGPVVAQLVSGEGLSSPAAAALDRSALGPLVHALSDTARQRRQALLAYQTQIEAVGLGEGLTPSNLASPAGRASVQQKLADLRTALDALVARDATVQAALEGAVADWLTRTPHWGDASARQALIDTSRAPALAMTSFFAVERDIVSQVDDLLQYLDRVGDGLAMESAPQPELVFTRADDLAYYRQALGRLGELGRREQVLLADAQKASGTHARRVGDVLMASSEGD